MVKITWDEMVNAFWEHNEKNGNDADPITAVVVFKASNWKKEYSVESRSYRVSSRNRAFQHGMIANSIFANCLDGTDDGVRLDWYNWEPEYCYMEE